MPKSKKSPARPPRGGNQDMLSMLGMADDNDSYGDDDMEAELNAILGNTSQSKPKKKPAKLLDWGELDAQISSSLRDVGEDDEDVTGEDEENFMDELNELVSDEEEPDLLQPGPARTAQRSRSPSPNPQGSGGIMEVLKSRKTMYETAAQNAQAAGESSKVRRLQRGVKTIDGMIRQAKSGKTISEDDIPPLVATGQKPTSDNPPQALPPKKDEPDLLNVSEPVEDKPSPVVVKSSASIIPAQKISIPPPEIKIESANENVDAGVLSMLESRKAEYRNAAIKAKHAGDKESALKYFKVLKQFESVIAAAKEGKSVDISQLPPSPNSAASVSQSSAPVGEIKQQSPAQQSTPTPQESTTSPAPAQTALAKPKTILEGLEQRMAKYKESSAEATKEGNSGKSRRMSRIVKQYQGAIRSHKAGKSVNFDDLPCPPGYPPLPGVNESSRDENLMQKATSLIEQDIDAEEPSGSKQQLQPPAPAPRKASPVRGEDQASRRKSPSPKPSIPKNPYEQQVVFLENRRLAFKKAALEAKKSGDKDAAIDFIRKMKGFDELIEAAKSGLKVDITKVPQPPADFGKSRDEGFEVIESHETSSKRKGPGKSVSVEEDDALYSRLLESLTEQINKARAYAQQMTHSGDVGGAERCDRLASSSQEDYDYVRSCRRHGDPSPRFYYENKMFQVVRILPDIGSNELELMIVQCIDLTLGKDAKLLVEWEMPFPHDNPIKGKTGEAKHLPHPKFDETFRVPFTRKLKSNMRAIKSKSIKLEIIQKGGFLRGDKSVGSCNIKLDALESHCELHTVEQIKDGRASVGKIEVYVRLRTPMVASDSQAMKERWVIVEHVKHPPKSHPQKVAGSSKSKTPNPSASPKVNISSIEVLMLDIKIARAKISKLKQRGKSPSVEHIDEEKSLCAQLTATKNYLKMGGKHAASEYKACLTHQYHHLSKEAEHYVKQGKQEQAKLALTKKSMVKKELESQK